LIVVSAPSGAGKTTLCDGLLACSPGMVYSVSCTTRPPRGREVDGEHYHFLDADSFEARVAAGEFLEHAVVHGHRYGTLKDTVRRALCDGCSVLMDIDVQGADQIRAFTRTAAPGDPIRDAFLDIFIAPPSLDALRERLEKRAEDAPGVIEQRLRNAAAEMDRADRYRYVIVNDDLETAQRQLREVVKQEGRRND
jgi:guanylate kinase